jgi:phosphoglycolate phosphatase
MIRRGLSLSGAVDEVLVEAAMPIFRGYYADHIADASRPFAGVEAAIDQLTANGVVCAICTNKPEMLARLLINALGWDGRFAAILGGDSVDLCKPNAQHVTATIAAAAGELESSVFVGDSSVDVAAARAAKIPVIAVSFGFADLPISELGADAVIDHYDGLIPLLRSRQW